VFWILEDKRLELGIGKKLLSEIIVLHFLLGTRNKQSLQLILCVRLLTNEQNTSSEV